jgi:hypothetical protein
MTTSILRYRQNDLISVLAAARLADKSKPSASILVSNHSRHDRSEEEEGGSGDKRADHRGILSPTLSGHRWTMCVEIPPASIFVSCTKPPMYGNSSIA